LKDGIIYAGDHARGGGYGRKGGRHADKKVGRTWRKKEEFDRRKKGGRATKHLVLRGGETRESPWEILPSDCQRVDLLPEEKKRGIIRERSYRNEKKKDIRWTPTICTEGGHPPQKKKNIRGIAPPDNSHGIQKKKHYAKKNKT